MLVGIGIGPTIMPHVISISVVLFYQIIFKTLSKFLLSSTSVGMVVSIYNDEIIGSDLLYASNYEAKSNSASQIYTLEFIS